LLIQVDPTQQDHIPKGAPVLVVAVGLDGHVLPKGKDRGGVLGFLAVGLAFLRAVDPAEANAFRVLVVQDFDRVAVEDSDDFALILRDSGVRSGYQESEEHNEGP
jgi:hypothetical protein